jgi:uncharacterized protein YndB with AHSA1/START domain
MIFDGNQKATLDRATHTISFQRVFPATREQVFDAWTKPEEVSAWWDPTGKPLSECTIDLRPGGAFRFVNQDSGHSPPFAGDYLIIERPTKLVFEALGAVGTVLLEEKSGQTRLLVTIRCASVEHLEMYLKVGVDVGTDRTLDNLVAYLAKRK